MIEYMRALEDGSTIVRDDADGATFVLKPGQFARVAVLPDGEQRGLVERFVLENRTAGAARSETDEMARETMQDATTGEAHQEGER
jgi:hypothetical protein